MNKHSEQATWECPDCGTRNYVAFGVMSFDCPACGFQAKGDVLQRTYQSVKTGLVRKTAFSKLNRPAFRGDTIPGPTRTKLQELCPFLGNFELWSDYSLFDVLWILKAVPNAIDILPLQTISRSDWNAIGKVADGLMASFVVSIGCRKGNAVASFIRDANADDLRRLERLLSSFGWAQWTDSDRDTIAHSLLDAVLKQGGKSVINEFSPDTKLNLWRADPVRSGIDTAPLIPTLAPDDLIVALKSVVLKPTVLNSISFDRWTPNNWLALLRMPGISLPDNVKIEINSHWNELCWSPDTLGNLVAENSKVREIFPTLPSEVVADMLLKHPQFSSWMSSEGWFNRISAQDWLRVIANKEVFSQPEVKSYAIKSVLPTLSDSDRDKLIEINLDVAVFYPIESLSEKTIVDLYSIGSYDACFKSFDFSSLSRPGWLSLLSRCGKRIPPATPGFFLKAGGGLDSAAVEHLLSDNPALLPFFSEKQISRLSTETFLRLCQRCGAPDFLVSAYPVKTWTRKSQEEFLARYPWTGKYFDWTSWPIWIIDRITKNNLMLARSYPHTIRLFIYRHWKWFTGLAASVLVAFGIGIASPNLRDMLVSYDHIATAREAAHEQAAKVKISENARLQVEAEAKIQDATAKKAKDDAEKAKAEAEKAKAEAINAKVRKAEAEAQTAKANAEKAKAEEQIKALETQKAEANKETAETVVGGVVFIAIIICIIIWKMND